MINRAIVELNDEKGSMEEAISEFIRREYEDLPWAHSKILSVHLERLCQVGELACNEDGKYVFPVVGEEEKERCEGSRKRKRGGRKSNRGDGDRKAIVVVESVEIESETSGDLLEEGIHLPLMDSAGIDEPLTQGKGEQVCESDDHSIRCVQEKTQTQAPNELEEAQIQMVNGIVCAEVSPVCIMSTGPGVEISSPSQLQPEMSTDIIDMEVVSKTTAALVCVNLDDGDELSQHYNQEGSNGNLDENQMFECLEKKQPKCSRGRKKQPMCPRGRPRNRETDVNCQEEPFLHKLGPTRNNKKQNGQTRGRGRPRKVIEDTEHCENILKKKDQAKLWGRGRGRGCGRGRGMRPKLSEESIASLTP